jgi:NhaP-type Na+/H+ or K+/H+ antiporter
LLQNPLEANVPESSEGPLLELILAFTFVVFFYSLVSSRLERTVITAPIVFTLAGALALLLPDALTNLVVDRPAMLLIAEIGLVLTLFTDATRVGPRVLAGNRNLPVRLLSTGMLLTIALGALAAAAVFDGFSWWEAGILAAVLAPTDAGLGAVIVNSDQVPSRIRQALNVEAGFNDGLSVPFLMLFIALASQTTEDAGAVLTRFLGEQLGYGTLIGLGVGLVGGGLLGLARRRGWMAEPLQKLGLVALPLLCVMLSEATHASMFIAAFVAGLAVQAGFKEAHGESVAFTEDWGQVFDYFVFFLFGLFVARDWHQFTALHVLYAVLSLTVVRMLPVAIALRGSGVGRATILFIGWFGPRGLASIVLGLVYLEAQASLPAEGTIRLAVMATVLMSIVAHGVSALPGIRLYARSVATLAAEAPERHAARE